MLILIEYRGRMYQARVIDSYKVSILMEEPLLGEGLHEIELDQCKRCGIWCTEDDEMYGGGYCTHCSDMCDDCQQYFSVEEFTVDTYGKLCTECRKKVYSAPKEKIGKQ